MSAESTLLVIDDDVELCELLTDYLSREGFVVATAHDARSGFARVQELQPSLVILDVMLPGGNGFDVLRELRKTSRVPVMMLTARGEDVDRIVGLELGADDYLPKPFNPRELVARIRAVQRRYDRSDNGALDHERICVADVELDLGARSVKRGGEEIALTTAEIALLEVLLRAAGHVVSREALSEKVLGRRFSPLDRSIDVHVSSLRKKLRGNDGRDRIKTVRGTGYFFAVR